MGHGRQQVAGALALAAATIFCCARASAQTTTVSFQNGKPPSVGGKTYNSTKDRAICTQYIDAYNLYNGGRYPWGSTDTPPVSDVTMYSSEAWRYLLRFDNLAAHIPAGAKVQSAQLTLSFINWNPAQNVTGCFMSTQWQESQVPVNQYAGTGWRFAYNTTEWSGGAGAWGDCSPDVSLKVNNVEGSGTTMRTLNLDACKVQSWLDSPSSNNGLLFKAPTGGVSVISSLANSYNAPVANRPILTVTYSTGAAAALPSCGPYPREIFSTGRIIYVATGGDDANGNGATGSPYKTPYRALQAAGAGDTIYLKAGVYPGGITFDKPGITMQSAPGEWAVIAAPVNSPVGHTNAIQIRPGANDGVLRNLEVVGGFYYAVMFFTDWEWYGGSKAEMMSQVQGIRRWTIEGCRLHSSGSSVIKMTMRVNDVTIKNCEIFNAGFRLRTYGHGIEGVQAHNVKVLDNYIHDIPDAGVHLVGGSRNSQVQRNFIRDVGFGMNIGFATELEYMDELDNPQLFESLGAVVANNIVAGTRNAGINLWAAAGAVVAHNTVWQGQEYAQSAILANAYTHSDAPAPNNAPRGCANLTIVNNVLHKSATARAGPVFQIREDGLTGGLVMGGNVYWDAKGAGLAVFQWGKGAMLEDERVGTSFVGNAPGWKQHCTATLGIAGCDAKSVEADPKLSSAYAPLSCSPAKGAGLPQAGLLASLPQAGLLGVAADFHGRVRTDLSSPDAGAVAFSAPGALKPFPTPTSPSSTAPYTGAAAVRAYDKSWPYDYWKTRACKTLTVNAVTGNDNQVFNYTSDYAQPYKTLQKAIDNSNQCDKIYLAAGQTHAGPVGIYKPNVWIETDPAQLAAKGRATLLCSNAQSQTCIIFGDGNYDGAAHATLKSFNVVMQAPHSGPCIQMNEGQGSGMSPYYQFYTTNAGIATTPLTQLTDMSISGCTTYGIKLSTFITGVQLLRVNISNTGDNGIEVRGGSNLLIQNCKVQNVGGNGILLGGGARCVTVERTLVENYKGIGIMVGSFNTEPQYMDVAYAQKNGWYDNVYATVRNNIVRHGQGAGVAFYSAANATCVHNTFFNVSATQHAAILFNVSPKVVSDYLEVGLANKNITVKNNVVVQAQGATTPMVEARVLQGSMAPKPNPFSAPSSACASRKLHSASLSAAAATAVTGDSGSSSDGTASRRSLRGVEVRAAAGRNGRQLSATPLPFAQQAADLPGTQGRNADGSCPIFPDDNPWHKDVSGWAVHPKSSDILSTIGFGTMRPDFGGGDTVNGQAVLYGIPFDIVNSQPGVGSAPYAPLTAGTLLQYASESDAGPYPFPPGAKVEGAFPYNTCPLIPGTSCDGDRHILVLDNSTCTLWEAWRAIPPALAGTTQVVNGQSITMPGTPGKWAADIVAKFNLLTNDVTRPLGWTSADAAGLPIYPGLIKVDETINKGVIDHAMRFTIPSTRRAYAFPATHFAPTGGSQDDPNAGYMGLRIRLKPDFDCSALSQVARVFCTALKKYGGVLADNGGRWFFSGEASNAWNPYINDLQDIRQIPASALEILDPGCLCLDAECSQSDCGGNQVGALPVYSALDAASALAMADNTYYRLGDAAPSGRYIDRRLSPNNYDGALAGWMARVGETGSAEANPQVNTAGTFGVQSRKGTAHVNPAAGADYYGTARPASGMTNPGAVV